MYSFLLRLVALLSLSEVTHSYKELDWWQSSLIYQIYPLSFKDSDGNGYGDLNGILEKLDYIKDIGVDVVWIQPFYKSPMRDLGYDVTDYKSVGSLFGTLEDIQKIINGVHARGMKLIMDFVPNHTSDESEWFKLSLQKVAPYTDFYIYKDPKKLNDTHSTYPNNWRCLFGGSAWTWREERQQYSLNQFSSKQPELNLRSPNVLRELENVMRFWLDMGVDGFRVDATRHFFEAEHFKDEPAIPGAKFPNDWRNFDHIYTMDQPEDYELIKSWSYTLLQEYKNKDGQTRLMSVEDYNSPRFLKKYLGNETHPGSQVPFYVAMISMSFKTNSSGLEEVIRNMTDAFPEGYYNWALDNHDNGRVSTRFNPESVDSLNMFTLLLPGVASIFFGSELGLHDIKTRPDQRQDPQNAGYEDPDITRDASRGPMLWDDTRNAGFTTAKKPWLPVNPNYYRMNVKAQQEDPNSHLNIFKRITKLRKTPVIQYGDFQTYMHKEWVYLFTRSLQNETIAVLMNIGSETEEACIKNSAPNLPDTMFVHTSSSHSGFSIGSKVRTFDTDETRCVQLRPFSTLVLSTSHGLKASYSIFILLIAAICSKLV